MKAKHLPAYIILGVILTTLGLTYFQFPYLRITSAILMGVSYFLWGIVMHFKDKTLHLPVVLEYLGLSLLGIMILIFISLRA